MNVIKNHQLHEDCLPSKGLHIDEINLALSQVVGGPVDSDEVIARPMGFGETRMDMTVEDVNRKVKNVQAGLVEAVSGTSIYWFRKQQFQSLQKMIAAAKDALKSEMADKEFAVVPKVKDVEFPDEILDLMLHTGVSEDNVDNGLISSSGVYRVVSQSNPKRYYYVDKQGYDYFRYVGVDAEQAGVGGGLSSGGTAAAPAKKMSDAEFVKQKPKKGKSGIMLYPAVVAGKQQWVTIPENESRQRAANMTEAKRPTWDEKTAKLHQPMGDAEKKKLYADIFVEVRNHMIEDLDARVNEFERDVAALEAEMKQIDSIKIARTSQHLEASRGTLAAYRRMRDIVKVAK